MKMNKGLLMLGMATLLSANVTANANAIQDVAADPDVAAAAAAAAATLSCELSKMFPVPAVAADYVNVSTANTTVTLDGDGNMDSISELVQEKAILVGEIAMGCPVDEAAQ